MTAFIIFLLVTPGSSLIAYAGREAAHPAKIQVVTLAQCIGQAFMAGPAIAIYRLGCTADGTIRAARLCALGLQSQMGNFDQEEQCRGLHHDRDGGIGDRVLDRAGPVLRDLLRAQKGRA